MAAQTASSSSPAVSSSPMRAKNRARSRCCRATCSASSARTTAARRATSRLAIAARSSRIRTSSSLQACASVSTTHRVPMTSPSGVCTGKPAHATTPIDSMDGLCSVRASVRTSLSTSGSPRSTTYWQNDSSSVFCRGPSAAMPRRLFQNDRSSSTTVRNANGAPSSCRASAVSRSKDSSAPVSSRPVARTAASRCGECAPWRVTGSPSSRSVRPLETQPWTEVAGPALCRLTVAPGPTAPRTSMPRGRHTNAGGGARSS